MSPRDIVIGVQAYAELPQLQIQHDSKPRNIPTALAHWIRHSFVMNAVQKWEIKEAARAEGAIRLSEIFGTTITPIAVPAPRRVVCVAPPPAGYTNEDSRRAAEVFVFPGERLFAGRECIGGDADTPMASGVLVLPRGLANFLNDGYRCPDSMAIDRQRLQSMKDLQSALLTSMGMSEPQGINLFEPLVTT